MNMKKVYGLYILLFLGMSVGCRMTSKEAVVYDVGVSKELAQWRKQTIENLKYRLSFVVPEEKSISVAGEVTIGFELEHSQEVVLDFRNAADNLKHVVVNGEVSNYTFKNEHIIIPQDELKIGQNEVNIQFIAGNQSLNRNDEFLYTLLVPDRARTVFPCFDQPDLKAEFILSLNVPNGWQAVSNTNRIGQETMSDGSKWVHFAPTEPLSSYLFSFVAGELSCQEYTEKGRTIAAYYRETDPKKVAQLDTIFKQVMYSLEWLEKYTGVPYPFAKYDFIILPGFQYGGMEHTGATLYNDTQMFLSENATLDEELSRAKLIAHETTHMWFGDYVTMAWFDDVWTKEVFANYFAACICEPLFPNVNHSLNWLRTYTRASLSEDRTPGTNAIKQALPNLNNAGLVYGQIIYNKAPIMMKKMVDLMGEECFRKGIQEYVQTFAYSNATWEELVEIMGKHTDVDLKAFSQVWVHEKGMPHLYFVQKGDVLKIIQQDPYKRGFTWPQSFDIRLCGIEDSILNVQLTDTVTQIKLPFIPEQILPNVDGRGYGLFIPDAKSLAWMLLNWYTISDDTERLAVLMTLYENYLAGNIADYEWLNSLFNGIVIEKNLLIASSVVSYFSMPLQTYQGMERTLAEKKLLHIALSHALGSCRTQLMRVLIANHVSPMLSEQLYEIWNKQNNEQLNENDYTTLAYELCVRCPEKCNDILSTQRMRITNPDRLRQFDFISRAVVSDTTQLDLLFNSLLMAENRRIEPWTAMTLSYLNHFSRGDYAVKYIRPALEALQDVQRTGDIFFPTNWTVSLLSQHRSKAAWLEVNKFLEEHPDYPQLLRTKILQAVYPLYRLYGRN